MLRKLLTQLAAFNLPTPRFVHRVDAKPRVFRDTVVQGTEVKILCSVDLELIHSMANSAAATLSVPTDTGVKTLLSLICCACCMLLCANGRSYTHFLPQNRGLRRC